MVDIRSLSSFEEELQELALNKRKIKMVISAVIPPEEFGIKSEYSRVLVIDIKPVGYDFRRWYFALIKGFYPHNKLIRSIEHLTRIPLTLHYDYSRRKFYVRDNEFDILSEHWQWVSSTNVSTNANSHNNLER
ncbi:MAG: hypothetical protein AB4368_13775 [Xenococcaceae cyanobacterium]